MSKLMAQLDEAGVIVNIIAMQRATPDTETLVTVPEGETAVIGGDVVEGVFFVPQPFPSWTRGDGEWVPPIPFPDDADSALTQWDEDAQNWAPIPAVE